MSATAEPRKVLYTTPFADAFGGGQQSLLLLLGALDRRRFSPVVLVPAEGEVARRARALGCDVRALRLPPLRSALAAAKACLSLRRLLREERISLIHTDAPRETLYASCARLGLGLPLVWHIRTEERDARLDRWLERRADRLILVARALENRFSMRARGRCAVVYNGVDLASPAPAEKTGLPACEGALLVCPARIDERQKAQHVLIAALPRVRDRVPAEAWFVGEGEEEYLARLRAQARALGVAGCVHFLGFRNDVRGLIALADVVVLPSNYEGLPRVLLEAMAEGKPVVATGVGGVPELVQEGETGLLVAPGDPAALAAALVELLCDPARARRMGEAGRRRASGFSVAAMARGVERIYDEEFSKAAPRAGAPPR